MRNQEKEGRAVSVPDMTTVSEEYDLCPVRTYPLRLSVPTTVTVYILPNGMESAMDTDNRKFCDQRMHFHGMKKRNTPSDEGLMANPMIIAIARIAGAQPVTRATPITRLTMLGSGSARVSSTKVNGK